MKKKQKFVKVASSRPSGNRHGRMNHRFAKKNWVVTYLKKTRGTTVQTAITTSTKRFVFVHHSEKKLTPFEAHHGLEDNTV